MEVDSEISYIQVLQCPPENDLSELYYIGRTKNIVDRFKRHQTHKGAKCLQNRPTIQMKELFHESPFLELVKTLEYMQKQGPEKVRGGPFVKEIHTEEDLATIENLIDSENFKRTSSVSSSPTENRPKRQGQKWTLYEQNTLVSMYKEKMSKEDISKHLERSPGSIELKLIHIVRDAKAKNATDEELAANLNLTSSQIQEIFAGHPVWP